MLSVISLNSCFCAHIYHPQCRTKPLHVLFLITLWLNIAVNLLEQLLLHSHILCGSYWPKHVHLYYSATCWLTCDIFCIWGVSRGLYYPFEFHLHKVYCWLQYGFYHRMNKNKIWAVAWLPPWAWTPSIITHRKVWWYWVLHINDSIIKELQIQILCKLLLYCCALCTNPTENHVISLKEMIDNVVFSSLLWAQCFTLFMFFTSVYLDNINSAVVVLSAAYRCYL